MKRFNSLKTDGWEWLVDRSIQAIKEQGTGINIQFFKGGIYSGSADGIGFVSPTTSKGSVWVHSDIARITALFGGNGMAMELPVLKECVTHRGTGNREFDFEPEVNGLNVDMDISVAPSGKKRKPDLHRFSAPACAFAMVGAFFRMFFSWAEKARMSGVPFPFPWPKNDVLKFAGFYGDGSVTLQIRFGGTMIPAMILVENTETIKEVNDD
ncbi:MAG: hypothetical protein D6732_08405 [Methanobacteriota archaeon]|nr:MAG: hypothetical protein D6732_08405 [Euryarchaeota archaeon]